MGHGSGSATLTFATGSPSPSVVLDYGADVGGTPVFGTGPSTTSGFTVEYSETLANLGDDGAVSVAVFRSGDPDRTVTETEPGGGGSLTGRIQGGERYERISLTSPGQLVLRRVGIRAVAGPAASTGPRGSFRSSDPLLDRIWYAGAYTLGLDQVPPGTVLGPGATTDRHLLVDGAKRDRAVWSGDQLVADLTDYYASDPVYARESLALLLEHPASVAGEWVPTNGTLSSPGPLPGACSPDPAAPTQCFTWSASYSMVVVPALDAYLRYTGDLGFVRRHWSAVERQMAWDAAQVGPDGLVAVTAADDSDWNIEQVPGELTYVNGVYVQALHAAADLATAIGRPDQAATWTLAAGQVSSAVNAQLWDPTTGVYDPSTTERGGVVQDANVLAVLTGIAGPGRATPVLAALDQALQSPYGPLSAAAPAPAGYVQDVSPYMGSLHLFADFDTGRTSAALSLVRQEWGYVVSHDPGGVDWERIQPAGVPAGGQTADSAAHAWSTGPTAALSEYVLGVAPVRPGYATWSIAPQPGDLHWAQGSVPTPHGTIAVRWSRTPGSFVVTESTPAGTNGTVTVPLGPDGTIARDGTVVWRAGRPAPGVAAHLAGTSVVFTQTAGVATFASASS